MKERGSRSMYQLQIIQKWLRDCWLCPVRGLWLWYWHLTGHGIRAHHAEKISATVVNPVSAFEVEVSSTTNTGVPPGISTKKYQHRTRHLPAFATTENLNSNPTCRVVLTRQHYCYDIAFVMRALKVSGAKRPSQSHWQYIRTVYAIDKRVMSPESEKVESLSKGTCTLLAARCRGGERTTTKKQKNALFTPQHQHPSNSPHHEGRDPPAPMIVQFCNWELRSRFCGLPVPLCHLRRTFYHTQRFLRIALAPERSCNHAIYEYPSVSKTLVWIPRRP